MKKKIIIIISSIFLISILAFVAYKVAMYIRIKNAKIEVTLVDNLNLEFNDKKKVSDFIKSINGKIIDDYEIDSKTLGKKDIKFEFINEDKIKVNYTFSVDVKDTVPPLIWLGESYNVTKNSSVNLSEKIFCGDNYDNNPNCYVEGDYDLSKVGNYPLVFKAIDVNGNVASQEFTLNVKEKSSSSSNKQTKTYFSDIVKNYKKENTKIGLDVSSWQGDIDFEKIKNAGVEFIIIRVGGTTGREGDYFLDKKFIRNITEAEKYDIDVGIYFYSYATSTKKARENAKWVLDQIKDYKVNLPIAFDWEEWSNFNKYNLSFFNLTSMAETYIKEVEKAGYKGMLYSSKNYLEKVWLKNDFKTWLAHYTYNTDYEGNYDFWQMCNDGIIDGIDGFVDIDIMYEK